MQNKQHQSVSLQKLSNASTSSVFVEKVFNSGARFIGPMKGVKKKGKGTFIWLDGSKYVGEFFDNFRHGKGVQFWPDNSKYDGDFLNDLRHGYGEYTWPSGDTYSGNFYRDHKHGHGTYAWSDGTTYVGYTCYDGRDGYGLFIDQNNTTFQGLYQRDQRFGPGVLTYSNGSQDVGFWHREKLLRLCVPLPGTFLISNHPEYKYVLQKQSVYVKLPSSNDESINSVKFSVFQENINYSQFSHKEVSNKVILPPLLQKSNLHFAGVKEHGVVTVGRNANENALSNNQPNVEEYGKNCVSDCCNANMNSIEKVNLREDDDIRYELMQRNAAFKTETVAWNISPLLMEMQQQILLYEPMLKSLSFDAEALMTGKRMAFAEPGVLECASVDLHDAVRMNQLSLVKDLLESGRAYVDVSDVTGNTPLIMAAMRHQLSMINCLLDHGADVNRLTDEGMSALTVCFVYYYPFEIFRMNIAEHKAADSQATEFIYHYTDQSVVTMAQPLSTKKKKGKDTLGELLRRQPTLRSKVQLYRLEQKEKTMNLAEKKPCYSVGMDNEYDDSQAINVDKTVEILDANFNEFFEEDEEEGKLNTSNTVQPKAVKIVLTSCKEQKNENGENLLHNFIDLSETNYNSIDALVPRGSVHSSNFLSVLIDESHSSLHVDIPKFLKPIQKVRRNPYDEFESENTFLSLPINVHDKLLDRYATNLCMIDSLTMSADTSESLQSGTVTKLTLDKIRCFL